MLHSNQRPAYPLLQEDLRVHVVGHVHPRPCIAMVGIEPTSSQISGFVIFYPVGHTTLLNYIATYLKKGTVL